MSVIAAILRGDVPADRAVALRVSESLTIDALHRDVAAVAEHLRGLGCRRGGIVCRDGYWLMAGLLGLLTAGAEVVFPPNAQAGTLARLGGVWDTVLTDDPTLDGTPVYLPGLGSDARPSPVTLREERVVFYTSGSTGDPKPVVRTLRELEREAMQLERIWGERAGTSGVYATVPHHHVYGLTFARLWPLVAGRPFAAAVHDFWESLLEDIAAGAVLITSPAHLTRLGGMTALEASRRPRLIFSAGAPLPHAAIDEIARVLGPVPQEIFGSTETGAIATRQQREPDPSWRPLDEIEIATGPEGRLRLRSPWVAGGDWFDTNDRVELVAGSHGFRLLGRVDRTVKVEGKRVSLIEVERRLTDLPWVADAVALIIPGGTEVLGAAVVLTAAGREELARRGTFRFTRMLRRELAAFLEPVAVPRRWRFPEALPAAPMGKRNLPAIGALFATEASA